MKLIEKCATVLKIVRVRYVSMRHKGQKLFKCGHVFWKLRKTCVSEVNSLQLVKYSENSTSDRNSYWVGSMKLVRKWTGIFKNWSSKIWVSEVNWIQLIRKSITIHEIYICDEHQWSEYYGIGKKVEKYESGNEKYDAGKRMKGMKVDMWVGTFTCELKLHLWKVWYWC